MLHAPCIDPSERHPSRLISQKAPFPTPCLSPKQQAVDISLLTCKCWSWCCPKAFFCWFCILFSPRHPSPPVPHKAAASCPTPSLKLSLSGQPSYQQKLFALLVQCIPPLSRTTLLTQFLIKYQIFCKYSQILTSSFCGTRVYWPFLTCAVTAVVSIELAFPTVSTLWSKSNTLARLYQWGHTQRRALTFIAKTDV